MRLTQTSRAHFWTNTLIQGGASGIRAKSSKGQLCGLGRQLGAGAVTSGCEPGVGNAKRRQGGGKGGDMPGVGTRASAQTLSISSYQPRRREIACGREYVSAVSGAIEGK